MGEGPSTAVGCRPSIELWTERLRCQTSPNSSCLLAPFFAGWPSFRDEEVNWYVLQGRLDLRRASAEPKRLTGFSVSLFSCVFALQGVRPVLEERGVRERDRDAPRTQLGTLKFHLDFQEREGTRSNVLPMESSPPPLESPPLPSLLRALDRSRTRAGTGTASTW
jgi:hypothetical protein